MKKTLNLLFASVMAMGMSLSAHAEEYIILASTTSTENSGLFDSILPKFKNASGIDVRVVAVGTGQAFELARRGDADSLLVHDTTGEQRFIDNGHATGRADVMYNDFVLIGPASDPANVRNARTAAEAFAAIANARAPFTSRGDDSGTNRAELRLWENAGVEPDGDWYRELGSGMGPTLNTAAAMDAYVMSDRATWVAFGNRQNLTLLFEGDNVLFNQYGSLLLSEQKHPHLKHDLARQWHNWLISKEGQQAIADFKVNGQQLFFPNAK
ncbi:substrate-binding domain-containing protein [Marinobacter excellens]|jgi:tungstate transport system substrate-binding protein|uniref:ABC-type tungstate transport system, periplasmic binding protein n=1 Tax=Marinobacter excellens LAMA 842 TaxID=1306954 RepID=A0A137S587_9GAMM|nr:substrate-binding domain-containing protein [Marinobacter excellens]KXO07597.1 ABC-type tungstate transport system, periplasmic binding protein [Marinobacter excellens LAMA 842]PKM04416.1 MAG: sulfate transporter [Gammaproteobacteria bacterium HGW-Gammaproteobacteria-6]